MKVNVEIDKKYVEPNAVIFACLRFNSFTPSKNAISLGLDPGQPPSIKSIPKISIFSASLNFAETDNETPSH